MYESNIIWLLKQLNISLDQYGREEMKDEDITPSQGWVLNYLFSCGEQAKYATDIHAESGISRAAISSILKGLKKGGYIEMRAVSGDDRKKGITLTAKAYRARETIESVLKRQMERLCSGLSGEELELFTYTLNRMISNIKTDCVKEE
ncbi:MarR family winged helix-turn-helix transcriptional regulator [Hungatella effluvii]|uniref:MarR family winged helix-turn-helix transcriptional regulator n=1 Tax=Hungatella effluvii TaxID=1096246 RepID=UPI0022E151DA|nr:MarR family winged helix-turn-helix transcriptional regulator [Hungatella effluvii]